MEIQWYPGHMAKTLSTLRSDIRLVDVVIRILDARIPKSSNNPLLEEMLAGRSSIVVLNKSDISDDKANTEWLSYFRQKGIGAVLTESVRGTGFKKVRTALKEAARAKTIVDAAKGKRTRAVRTMVVGIPNVGKSSFINRITGRSAAITGEKPGLTRGRQWIRLNPEIEIMDTPGLLWPDLKDGDAGMNLAVTGAINAHCFDIAEAAVYLIHTLERLYPGNIGDRYSMNDRINEDDPYGILKAAGKKRGCILPGGEIDLNRISMMLLDEFRTGKLGRITLERP